MGPTIILDKSSIQALSKKELVILNKLFFINIPPILTIEILADLKRNPDDLVLNKEQVIELSNKIIQHDNAINLNHHGLIISSLSGVDFLNERRPIVGGAQKVKDKSGKIGMHIKESKEEKALRNWQNGNFTEAEKILASDWRHFIQKIDIKGMVDSFKNIKNIYPICKDLNSLTIIVDNLLSPESLQPKMVYTIVSELNVEQQLASKIFYRWESGKYISLKDFAPYVHFHQSVDLFFRLGLVYKLISHKTTNLIDLEYLYYLPFCNVFCSRDNFHKSIVPVFLKENQTFLNGDILKKELNSIILRLEEIKEFDWNSNFLLEPPEDNRSLCYNLWKNFLPAWEPKQFYKKLDLPKKDKNISKKIKSQIESYQVLDIDYDFQFHDSEFDFVSKEYFISLNDQCPCGSGKKLKDCCYRK